MIGACKTRCVQLQIVAEVRLEIGSYTGGMARGEKTGSVLSVT